MAPEDLARARAERLGDVAALEQLAQDQIDYLARVDELDDPETDGMDCDAEIEYG